MVYISTTAFFILVCVYLPLLGLLLWTLWRCDSNAHYR
jgi:hypothetical protein